MRKDRDDDERTLDAMNRDFAGSGDALLTSPLRAYRAWNLEISIEPTWTSDDLLRSAVGGKVIIEPGELRGYSLHQPFRVTRSVLLPVAHGGYRWRADNVAQCDVDASIVDGFFHGSCPSERCTCGFYAWYHPQIAKQEHTAVVFGAVDALGTTLCGTRGLRAEKMRVRGLTVNPDLRNFMPLSYHRALECLRYETRAGGRYEGVEVFDNERHLLEVYPPDLDTVTNLIGERPAVPDYEDRTLAGLQFRGTGLDLAAGDLARRIAAQAVEVFRKRLGHSPDGRERGRGGR